MTGVLTVAKDDVVDSEGDGEDVVAVHPGIATAGFVTVGAGVIGSHPEAADFTGVDITDKYPAAEATVVVVAPVDGVVVAGDVTDVHVQTRGPHIAHISQV